MLVCSMWIRPLRGLSKSAINAITTDTTIGVTAKDNQNFRFKLYPHTKLWKAATKKMINHTVLGTRLSNAASRFSATSNMLSADCM